MRNLLILSLVLASACKKSDGPAPGAAAGAPARVELVSAERHHFEPLADLSGEIRPTSLANLTSQVEGNVTQLTVEEGDHVKAGQLLALIDDTVQRASLSRAQATVAVARATHKQISVELDTARTELARGERLFAAKALDEQTLTGFHAKVDSLTAQVGTVEAQIRQALADVEVAESNLAQHRIVAPIAGVVVKRYARRYEHVAKDKPILDLIDPTAMDLVTNVPADAAKGLAVNGKLSFAIPSLGDRSFDGTIVAVIPQLDVTTRTLRVRARIDNATGELMGGMFAIARVPAGAPRDSLALPDAAVRGEEGARWVWVVKDGKVERATVTIGARDAGQLEIASGLEAGAQVVLGGADGLKPGAAVIAATAGKP